MYHLFIKSHNEAPDYEDECEAKDMSEAAKIFVARIIERIPMNKEGSPLTTSDIISFISKR